MATNMLYLCLMAATPTLATLVTDCQHAIANGLVGRPCSTTHSKDDLIVVSERRRLRRIMQQQKKTSGGYCNADDTCTDDSVYVTLGNGCFWERQYAYYLVEQDSEGPFNRQPEKVSARVGYVGSKIPGAGGKVCYHSGSHATDYSTLGYAETVMVRLDKAKKLKQFTALIKDFFGSFTWDADRQGMRRPDDFSSFSGDHGRAYRSVISIPGGANGELYRIIVAENKQLDHPMKLVESRQGGDTDEFNTVYIMDSDMFDFYIGEAYHQFHSNFFGPSYPSEYLGMYNKLKASMMVTSHGCPESSHWRRR